MNNNKDMGFRIIKDGTLEPKNVKAELQFRQFQFLKSKKKGRKK